MEKIFGGYILYMSGIGGIMNIENYGVNMEKLRAMSLSLSLRGRKRSTAFSEGKIGMFFNSSSGLSFEKDEDRQPEICRRRGNSYVLCIDGEGFDTSSVLEKYLVFGVEAIGSLDGPFSLALYDGEREMLILARDRRGRRPLFYTYDGIRLYFGSEVKAIIEAKEDCANVNREMLARHLVSPVGVYSASDIYCDIDQVLPGECVLFTSMGMSRFFYRDIRDISKIRSKGFPKKYRALIPFVSFDTERIFDCLNDSLIAYDFPQFDPYMPSLSALLSASVKEGREVVYFEDYVKARNIHYSYEREDRLGNLYGVRAVGVLPKNRDWVGIESLEHMKKILYERFLSIDPSSFGLLKSILGSTRFDVIRRSLERDIRKKEDAEDSIRTLGMLLQTIEWTQANRLLIKNYDSAVCCDYM